MIKIIKDGVVPKKTKTIYTIVCDTCGCEFECEGEDFICLEKGLHMYRSIQCPCCKNVLKLSEDKIKYHREEIE